MLRLTLWSDLKTIIVNQYKGKGDALNRSNYRGMKLVEQVMNVLERVVEELNRQRIEIDEKQCGSCLAVALLWQFLIRQLQERHLAANKPLYMAFVDLEKAFNRNPLGVICWAMAGWCIWYSPISPCTRM